MSSDSSNPQTEGTQHGNLGNPYLGILKTAFIFISSQLAAIIAVALGLFLYGQITGNQRTVEYIFSNINGLLKDSAALQFFYILVAETIVVLLVLAFVRLRKLGLSVIGLGRRPQLRDVGQGILAFLAFYAVLVVVGLILSQFIPDLDKNQAQDIGFDSLKNSTDRVLAFSALVFLPSVAEEILMRGYLYGALRAHWRLVPAMLVTSLLFGSAHLQSGVGGSLIWVAALDTFLLSAVLVFLRERTGALYAGMLVHALNNSIAFVVLFRA